MNTMTQYKAHVRNGRLVLDVATDLPDGVEVVLVSVTADDLEYLDPAERRAVLDDISAGDADEREGRGEDADDFLRSLRKP